MKPNFNPSTNLYHLTTPGIGGPEDFPMMPRRALDEAVLVRAQNVHDYFQANHQLHNWEDLRSFFAVRPPFPRMVLTYDHAFKNKQDGRIYERHVDVIVTERNLEFFSHYFKDEANIIKGQINELTKMIATVSPDRFLEVRMGIDAQEVPGRWFVMIDASGKVLTNGDLGWVFVKDYREDSWINRMTAQTGDDMQEIIQDFFSKHGAIALATLQFMNCKNVEVVDHTPSRQQRRHAERTGTRQPVTYKTLVIHPMGRKHIQAVAGQDQLVSGVQPIALHICRGHFKDYRLEAGSEGLGRWHVHGVWWWSPQVRGSAATGRVVKDYEVGA